MLRPARYRAAAERAASADRRRAARTPTARSAGRGRTAGRSAHGVLEDYAHLADGLLALYEATFDERWFTTARGLMDRVLAHFADPAGGFFDTADDHERLVTRPKDVQDNAVPSGNAMAARVLLRLAAWTGEGTYRDAAERAMRTVVPYVARYPTGFAQWLVGDGPRAVAGRPRSRSWARPTTRRPTLAGRGHGAATARTRSSSLAADPACERGPAAGRPGRDRRTPDRLRLPRLRLPPAGHRGRCPGRPARGSMTEGGRRGTPGGDRRPAPRGAGGARGAAHAPPADDGVRGAAPTSSPAAGWTPPTPIRGSPRGPSSRRRTRRRHSVAISRRTGPGRVPGRRPRAVRGGGRAARGDRRAARRRRRGADRRCSRARPHSRRSRPRSTCGCGRTCSSLCRAG